MPAASARYPEPAGLPFSDFDLCSTSRVSDSPTESLRRSTPADDYRDSCTATVGSQRRSIAEDSGWGPRQHNYPVVGAPRFGARAGSQPALETVCDVTLSG
jgi:hypothetical protein